MRMVAVAVVRAKSSNPRKRDRNLSRWPDRTDLGLRKKSRKGRWFRAYGAATAAVSLHVCRRCRAIYRHDDDRYGTTADLCRVCFGIIANMRGEDMPRGWPRAKWWEHTYTIRVAKLYLRDYAEWKKRRG